MIKIGVLALQGAFAKHLSVLKQLNVASIEVRKLKDLDECDALIIPGGESTTISRQLDYIQMNEKLKEFSRSKPIFGTCAGLILMSKQVLEDNINSLCLLDITTERNAFGRQIDSFITDVDLKLGKQKKIVPAVFIRAPRIRKWASEVEILACYKEEPILIKQGLHLGATFHPELTSDTTIHEYFVSQCLRNLSDVQN